MYSDVTTMYTDILSYDDNTPQLLEPNKLSLPTPTDPWWVTQYPATVTASSTDLPGRLSPTMEKIANSLLSSEVTLPLMDDDSFDIDVAINLFTPPNGDSLGPAMESLVLEPPSQKLEEGTPRRRSKRLSSRAASLANYDEPHVSEDPHPHPAYDFGAPVDQSTWSNVGDEDDDESSRAQRKRRPRVSYNTLTENQKYQRIRDLNNEASRLYRGRVREQLTSLQQKEIKELERNKVLKTKAEGLERLRDEIKEFTYTFFSQHVGNHGPL